MRCRWRPGRRLTRLTSWNIEGLAAVGQALLGLEREQQRGSSVFAGASRTRHNALVSASPHHSRRDARLWRPPSTAVWSMR
jgi:hypothetical protein